MNGQTFIKKADAYQRTLQPIEQYIKDASLYLAKMTGDPVAETRAWVIKNLEVKDPKALVLVRGPQGDRQEEITTLGTFLSETLAENNTLAPSLTSYLNPEVKPSQLAQMLEQNLSLRTQEKAQAAQCRAQGDTHTAEIKDTLQQMRKLLANGLSGSHLSQGCITYNPSAHNALTATGRCATSYATAHTERFLAGRRHYWRHDIARNNILSIVSTTDMARLQQVLEQYQLVYPSQEDVIGMLKRSCKDYWSVTAHWQTLVELTQTLTPLERAAVLYTQDLHSLSRLNEEVVKTFLEQLTAIAKEPLSRAEANALYHELGEEEQSCIALLCADRMAGHSLKTMQASDHPDFALVMATARQFLETLQRYEPLIQTLWRTDHLPGSIAMLPTAMRSHVLHSDTDSTLFTVAPWVEWQLGSLKRDARGVGLAAVMVYLNQKTLSHVLACFSTTLGVEPRHRFRLVMKNEYLMESMIMTGRGKHYIGRLLTREGRLLSEPALEIKGSGFKNTKLPALIRTEFPVMVNSVLDDLQQQGQIKIVPYLHQCADLERQIFCALQSGSAEYLVYQRIEDETHYAQPLQSVYFHRLLWQSVFAPKYGELDDKPYTAVKIPTTAHSITTLKQWTAGLNDTALRQRFEAFLRQHRRVELKVIYLPLDKITTHGLPAEVMAAADLRRIVASAMEPFYLLMESLGYFCRNDRLTRLFSDEF